MSIPRSLGFSTLLAFAVLLVSCNRRFEPEVKPFDASHYPRKLSAWGVVKRQGDVLVSGRRVLPYDLNTPLFTDYAHKFRTLWIPADMVADYAPRDTFHFPIGTILSKTFYYPRGNQDQLLITEDDTADFRGAQLDFNRVRLVETRLLVKQPAGWDALPYVWDDAQADASLEIAGDLIQLRLASATEPSQKLNYVVPTRNDCAGCHAADHSTGRLRPIGPKARHINKTYRHYPDGKGQQIARWVKAGFFRAAPATQDIPRDAHWQANRYDDLERRSRSYLDINCGHCHNARGAADTSGLFLDADETDPRRLGVCKPPVAAGRGSGNRLYDLVPGHPEKSIMTFRMGSVDPAEMMPELGRGSVHHEGLALIQAWIRAMPGNCD